jgi:phage shock protein C
MFAIRKLHISKKDKKNFGVCGGIAETYDLDPTVVRLAVVLLSLFTAVVPIPIVYIVASFIMPEAEE